MKTQEKVAARQRRHRRVRKKVIGSAERPRLAVFRSNRHIYAQLIDDVAGRTIASASTLGVEAAADPKEMARTVGRQIAERARAQGVSRVVFDRGGFIYHGRVAALAEGARETGLEF